MAVNKKAITLYIHDLIMRYFTLISQNKHRIAVICAICGMVLLPKNFAFSRKNAVILQRNLTDKV